MKPHQYLKQCFEESVRIKTAFYEENQELILSTAKWMAEQFSDFPQRNLIVMGNGGSASDALHLQGELLGRLTKERGPLSCIVLGSGLASLTAISNDYSYESAFKREMQGIARQGDMVFAISTSGNSKNILQAAEYAKDIECTLVGLTGNEGGKLGLLCDIHFNVAQGTLSSRIQETHIWLIHVLIDLMDQFFLK